MQTQTIHHPMSANKAMLMNRFDHYSDHSRSSNASYGESNSRAVSQAEATARRLAKLANSRKQPLSTRNQLWRQKLASTTSKYWDNGDHSARYENDDDDDDDDDDYDEDSSIDSTPDVPHLIRFDSVGSESSSKDHDFENAKCGDRFNAAKESSSPTRQCKAPEKPYRSPEKRGVGRLASRTTKTKLAVQAARQSKDAALEEHWRKVDEQDEIREERRLQQEQQQKAQLSEASSHQRRNRKPREADVVDDYAAQFSDMRFSSRSNRPDVSPRLPSNKSLDKVLPQQDMRHSSSGRHHSTLNAPSMHDRSICTRQTSASLDTALKKQQRQKRAESKAEQKWGKSWGSDMAFSDDLYH